MSCGHYHFSAPYSLYCIRKYLAINVSKMIKVHLEIKVKCDSIFLASLE